MFYLPLGIIIPPSHFIAHHQFNLIYQLWIHTTVIDNLGLLELIFNTPKHHRVHHGEYMKCYFIILQTYCYAKIYLTFTFKACFIANIEPSS